MHGYWSSTLLNLSVIAVPSAAIGLLFGPVAGLSVACLGLLLLVAMHVYFLARLRVWLDAPKPETLPEGMGIWENAFSGLYHAARRERRERDEITQMLQRFRDATNVLPVGIVLLDAAQRVEWCNISAAQHFSLDAERDRGISLTHLVRQPEFTAYLAEADPHEPVLLHPVHRPGDSLSIQLIPFAEDSRLLISHDITRIERIETMRRDFIANVSHELRTPLTVINGFLELLTQDAPEDPKEATRYQTTMLEQSRRMMRLVEDLLTLSRLEVGDRPAIEEVVDVQQLVGTLADEARGLSGGSHRFELEVSAGNLKGSTDELRSAFGNLISNAIRYTPPGGLIKVRWSASLEPGAKHGVFSVQDTGIGISPEHIPRLTERFYRVDRSRSRETGGTGLGLAIVKHVLLRHQATLKIEAELGKGSRFSAEFPALRVIAS
jgi:two-component system, OmpR family, phosphate regulon sensor histidine kinase PhoR